MKTEEEKKKKQQLERLPDIISEPEDTGAQQPAPQPEEETTPPAHDYYADILKAYDERKQADERADRRDRIREAIGGIGDVASALSNLYFTTQYAPNVPQTQGMSDKMRERYERAKANRDKNRGEWMNYMLNVAGRKQAADQAEANRQANKEYHNAIIAQREAAAQATADAKAAAAEEKAAKDWAKGYAKQWEAAAIDGSLDYDETLKWIENNATSDAHKTAAINALNDAVGNADRRTNYYKYQQENKVNTGGGRGSGGSDQYTYIGFGDGGGVNIRKNDKEAIKAAYDKLPASLKRYSDKQTEYEQKVRAYLLSNPNTPEAEAIKDYLRQTSKRQQKPTQSGEKTGSLLPKKQNNNGGGSLLPKK